MQGGIVWRIVMEVLASDAIKLVMTGPSSHVVRFGKAFLRDGGPPYHDDALTAVEEDFICGVYYVPTQTRKYSHIAHS